MRFLKQSTSVDLPIGPFLDATDGITEESGLTITQPDVRLKKNGGAWAQKNAAQTLSHEENGWYEVTLDATDTDTLGQLLLAVDEAGAVPIWHEFMVMPANVWDSLFGADALQVHANEITAGLITAAAIAANAIDADALAADAVAEIADGVWDEDATGHQTQGTFGQAIGDPVADTNTIYKAVVSDATGATVGVDAAAILADTGTDGVIVASLATGSITAGVIAADAIGSSELATSAVDEIVDAVWDEAHALHLSSTTFGGLVASQLVWRGTAQAGAAGTITLDAGASATDDIFTNMLIQIISGTGAGQARFISDYVGATKVATVNGNWVITPDNTSVFIIKPFSALPGATAPTAGEVADAVWDEAQSGHTTAGTFGKFLDTEVSGVGGGTAADIADAVWDEAMSGHVTAGTFGQAAQGIRSGTAQAGAAGTITLDASASATDDFYNDAWVFITGGTGVGQVRMISDYVGSTKVASIVPNWATNPDATSVFIVLPGARSDIHMVRGSALNTLVGGRMDSDVGAMQAGVVTAAAIATDAIDSDAIAASAVTEIQSGLATQASVDTIDDFLDTEIAAILADTNELQTDWADGGRLDLILDDAAADEALDAAGIRAAVGLASANLDTQLTAIDDLIDTEVAAIKSDTAAILLDTGTDGVVVAAASKSGYALSSAGVDAIWDEPLAEPAGVFNWATTRATFRDLFQWLGALGRNKITQTATTQTLRNDADNANLGTATTSDDGTTATRGEWS